MVHLARSGSSVAMLIAVFERFEASYGEHAHYEAAFLRAVDDRLDTHQRERLAELLQGV